MIVLTGAGGFIGSVILGYLNKQGIKDVLLFDDLPNSDQYRNLLGKEFLGLYSVEEESMFDFKDIECVIHFGANSSTLEKNWKSIYQTNVLSTRQWHDFCLENGIKFIFASSAAVYGNGEGPLNQYAFSKAVSEKEITAGVILRLFNVYGPNEHHKGRMASTPYHWYYQLRDSSEVKIFNNSNQYYRDFIWVEDVARTVHYFINNYQEGIYDLGTGKSVNFESVANECLKNMPGQKKYISMPEDLRLQYQTNTCANIDFLRQAGVDVDSFVTVEDGIREYFDYLSSNKFY